MWSSPQALVAIALASLCLASVDGAGASQRVSPDTRLAVDAASADVRFAAQWIAISRDNKGLPFVIVDKRKARLYVFDRHARLAGASSVLLGMARGDESAPGVGELPPSRIPVGKRTTPAGRFVSEPGHNLDGEDVVWFDYNAGLAIHRLRSNAAYDARKRRLAEDAPDAHRVSAGCVVVPVDFYERVIRAFFGKGKGVVYVLPETRSVREMFTARESDL